MTAPGSPIDSEQELLREREARERAEQRVDDLESSTSYRLGHSIVLALKQPLRVLRAVVLALFRQAYGRLPEHRKRSILGWTEDHLPRGVQRRLRAANARMKTSARVGARTATRKAGSRSPDGSAGRSILSDDLPVRGYALIGFDAQQLRQAVRSIRTDAAIRGDHVPLIITDSLAFGSLRDERVAFEYLPGPEALARATIEAPWQDFLQTRLAHLRVLHSLESLLVASADDRTIRTILGMPAAPSD